MSQQIQQLLLQAPSLKARFTAKCLSVWTLVWYEEGTAGQIHELQAAAVEIMQAQLDAA